MDAPAKVRKTTLRAKLLQSSKSDPPTLDPPDTVDLVDAPFTVAPLQTDLVVATDTTGPDFKAKKAKTETQKKQEALDKIRIAREVHLPQLTSPDQIVEDMTVHRSLLLTVETAHLGWLRKMPNALRLPGVADGRELEGICRAEAMEICQQNLPHLMGEPARAVSWLCKIASLLTWYEMEGPLNPRTRKQVFNEAEKNAETEKVREWDESYRSLWGLFRQGLLHTFCIESERFSIFVSTKQKEPMAVIWPSTREIRGLLHENHAYYSVDGEAPSDGPLVTAGVPSGSRTVSEQTLAELRELHRDGEKATTVGLGDFDDALQTSALLFQGKWRVHVMLDVLRQYFLGQPNPSAPPSPARLPRLLSPKPFVNASTKMAEVVKLASDPSTELRGRFFPQQLQQFLTLLRVCYSKFRCEFNVKGPGGLNAFTLLKQHRIDCISCDRVDGLAADKWHFRVI